MENVGPKPCWYHKGSCEAWQLVLYFIFLQPCRYCNEGVSISIVNNKLWWWFGPEFLLRNKESWLEDKFVSDVTDELRSDAKSNVAVNVEFIDHPKQKISAIININKYGSLIKVLKISFYVLKFLNIIYQKTFKKSVIKINNIFDGELLWLRHTQCKDIVVCINGGTSALFWSTFFRFLIN